MTFDNSNCSSKQKPATNEG